MHATAEVATWAALATGLLILGLGLITLTRHAVVIPWLRRRMHWKRWGWAQVLLGLGVSLQALPRLTGASPDLVLLGSVAALVLLVAGVALVMRSEIDTPGSVP